MLIPTQWKPTQRRDFWRKSEELGPAKTVLAMEEGGLETLGGSQGTTQKHRHRGWRGVPSSALFTLAGSLKQGRKPPCSSPQVLTLAKGARHVLWLLLLLLIFVCLFACLFFFKDIFSNFKEVSGNCYRGFFRAINSMETQRQKEVKWKVPSPIEYLLELLHKNTTVWKLHPSL